MLDQIFYAQLFQRLIKYLALRVVISYPSVRQLLAMALLAVANVLFIYGLARSKFNFLWPLTGGVGLMTGLIFFFHDTALTIAHILLLSIGTILTATFLMSFLAEKKPHLL